MKIFLGADHGGFYLKEKIEAYLSKRGIEWEDVGGKTLDPNDDFPQFAQMAAIKVLGEDEKTDPRAILMAMQSLCAYPSINPRVLANSLRMNTKEFNHYLDSYPDTVADMLIRLMEK